MSGLFALRALPEVFPRIGLFARSSTADDVSYAFPFSDLDVTLETTVPHHVERVAMCGDCPAVVYDARQPSACPRCNRAVEAQSLPLARLDLLGRLVSNSKPVRAAQWAVLAVVPAAVIWLVMAVWLPRFALYAGVLTAVVIVLAVIARIPARAASGAQMRVSLLFLLVAGWCPKCGSFTGSEPPTRQSRQWGTQGICPSCGFPTSGGIVCVCGEVYDPESAETCPRCGTVAARGQMII